MMPLAIDQFRFARPGKLHEPVELVLGLEYQCIGRVARFREVIAHSGILKLIPPTGDLGLPAAVALARRVAAPIGRVEFPERQGAVARGTPRGPPRSAVCPARAGSRLRVRRSTPPAAHTRPHTPGSRAAYRPALAGRVRPLRRPRRPAGRAPVRIARSRNSCRRRRPVRVMVDPENWTTG